MSLNLLFSKAILLNRSFLWLLFLINLGGTIYGYIWYEGQLIWTYENFPAWLLPFVPDSPTSSLFFTITTLYLLYPPKGHHPIIKWTRSIIEALGVVCCIKYGVWATVMILAGAAQGDALNWQSYMLMTSHIAMAVEVLLYVRFLTVNKLSFLIATLWLLVNDTLDYGYGIYPYLPYELYDNVTEVMWFTFMLSFISLFLGWFTWSKRKTE